MIVTIGKVRPKGICGSGLINMAAVMFEMGVINNLGKFDPGLRTPRLRETDGGREFVLAWKGETQIDRDITISEIDFENLIRPANYPPGNPGRGWSIQSTPGGVPVGVMNLQGQVFMANTDSPFRVGDACLEEMRGKHPGRDRHNTAAHA